MAIYKITNVGANKCLNIYGDNVSVLKNNQNVTLWDWSNSNEQKWDITSIGASTFIKSIISTSFGLNIYTTNNNCDVYPISGNEADARVDFQSTTGGYRIKLNRAALYLTAGASTNGTNVYWAALNSSNNYQVWATSSITVAPIAAPTTSTVTTCKVQCSIYQGCTYSTHLNGAHKGVDIAPVTRDVPGDPVYSILAGTATVVPGYNGGRGNYVSVDSTRYTIIYQHLDSIIVSNGAVSSGQKIGTMGKSGDGTGVHLHVEVYDKNDKKYINYTNIIA